MFKFKHVAVLLVISLMFSVLSCSGSYTFTIDGEYLVDSVNDRVYVVCSPSLRARSLATGREYARVDRHMRLFVIGDRDDILDPAEWLSEDISQGFAFVFREKSVEEPTLRTFEPYAINVTETEIATLHIFTIENLEHIEMFVNAILYGETVIGPAGRTHTHTLNFISKKYPWLQYVVQYVEYNGRGYLHDRGLGRWVEAPVIADE